MKKTILKTLALMMTAVFTFSSLGFAAPNKVYTVQIPEEFGTVKERYQGTTDEVVVHIQDAHTSFDAQKNLCNIIEYLVNQKDVRAVASEGGEGIANLPTLRNLPFNKEKRAACDHFLRDGSLKGAEVAQIVSPNYFLLEGVEDMDLYDLNFDAFLTTMHQREEILDQIEQVESILNDLKGTLYSEKTKAFDAIIASYAQGTLSFFEYCGKLLSFSRECGIDISQYVNFTMLLEAKSWEEQIDFDKVDGERTAAIDAVAMNLMTSDDAISKKKYEIFKRELDVYNAREDKKSAGSSEFNTLLKNLATEQHLDEEQFANFYNFAIYLSLFVRLDKSGLLGECKTLQRTIGDLLGQGADEKQLISLVRNVQMLKEIVELKVLPEDVEYYRENKESFASAAFASFIAKHNASITVDMSLLDTVLPSVDDFYRFAEERSDVLTANAVKLMEREGETILPFVSGGYHTDGITKALKEKGISYLVVTPQIEEAVENVPYLDRMLNAPTAFDMLIQAAYNTLSNKDAAQLHKDYEAEVAAYNAAVEAGKPEGIPAPPAPVSPMQAKSLELKKEILSETIKMLLFLRQQNPEATVDAALTQALSTQLLGSYAEAGLTVTNVDVYIPQAADSDIRRVEVFTVTNQEGEASSMYSVYKTDDTRQTVTQEAFNALAALLNKVENADVIGYLKSELESVITAVVGGETVENMSADAIANLLFGSGAVTTYAVSAEVLMPEQAKASAKAIIEKHASATVDVKAAVKAAADQTGSDRIAAVAASVRASAASIGQDSAYAKTVQELNTLADALDTAATAGDEAVTAVNQYLDVVASFGEKSGVALLPVESFVDFAKVDVADTTSDGQSITRKLSSYFSAITLHEGTGDAYTSTSYFQLSKVTKLISNIGGALNAAHLVAEANHELRETQTPFEAGQDPVAYEKMIAKKDPKNLREQVAALNAATDGDTGLVNLELAEQIVQSIQDVQMPFGVALQATGRSAEPVIAGTEVAAANQAVLVMEVRQEQLQDQAALVEQLNAMVANYSTAVLPNVYISVPGFATMEDAARQVVETVAKKVTRTAQIVDADAFAAGSTNIASFADANTVKIVVAAADRLATLKAEAGLVGAVVGVQSAVTVEEAVTELPVFLAGCAVPMVGLSADEIKNLTKLGYLQQVQAAADYIEFAFNPDYAGQIGDIAGMQEAMKAVLAAISGRLEQQRIEAQTILAAA